MPYQRITKGAHGLWMCHMYDDVIMFIYFPKFDAAKDITLGYEHSVEALGIVTVELNVSMSDRKQQRCRVYEMLYFAKMSHDLLSVSIGTRLGKTFTFMSSTFGWKAKNSSYSFKSWEHVQFELYWRTRGCPCSNYMLEW